MKKIYLAAPLFNEMELSRNKEIALFLENLGYQVYLPQEAAGIASTQINQKNKMEVNKYIFNTDVEGIKSCDILLFLLDGRVPDEGACVELGIAYALGKKCIGYKTDTRSFDKTGDDNLIIEGCFNFKIAKTIVDLEKFLLK